MLDLTKNDQTSLTTHGVSIIGLILTMDTLLTKGITTYITHWNLGTLQKQHALITTQSCCQNNTPSYLKSNDAAVHPPLLTHHIHSRFYVNILIHI